DWKASVSITTTPPLVPSAAPGRSALRVRDRRCRPRPRPHGGESLLPLHLSLPFPIFYAAGPRPDLC
ncbi:hypothetical protein BHE74_00013203, partial [Ensete ventricosum]